jgi:hypothetical protein
VTSYTVLFLFQAFVFRVIIKMFVWLGGVCDDVIHHTSRSYFKIVHQHMEEPI